MGGEAGRCRAKSEKTTSPRDDDDDGGGDENRPRADDFGERRKTEERISQQENGRSCNTGKTDNRNPSSNSWKIRFMIKTFSLFKLFRFHSVTKKLVLRFFFMKLKIYDVFFVGY